MNKLVLARMRSEPAQAAGELLAVSFEVALILALVGIRRGLMAHPLPRGQTMVGTLATILLWCVLGFDACFVMLSTYSAMLERAAEIGILRMLGASWAYLLGIVGQETLLVAVPGTLVGVVFAYVSQLLLASFVTQETAYGWWPIAGVLAASVHLAASLLAFWKLARLDIIETLSDSE